MYGFLEDNIDFITRSWKPFSFQNYSEPLFFNFYGFLTNFIFSITLYHLFLFIIFVVNFFFLNHFYKKFIENKYISIFLSIITIFSPYLIYKSQNHLVLLNLWILVLYISLSLKLVKEKLLIRYYSLIGLVFGLTILVSNYLSFFGMIFSVIFLGINFLVKIHQSKFNINLIKDTLIKVFILYISVLIPILIFNFNYILANFFSDAKTSESAFVLKRSIDDFFIFSSRPWYYFLPSVDNPFYGEFSKNILNFLEFNWGNYLAKNYFKSEHSSSYLGITNFILAILGFFYLRKNKEKIENYSQIIFLGITALILVLFTMPPFLEFKGFRIYFPSYLIAEYFSMFRVLSRMGILILIIQLIYTGYGFIYIFDKFKLLGYKIYYSYLLCIFLFLISLSEFFIPFKMTDVSQLPDVYSYIKVNTLNTDKLVIFPRGKSIEGFFWFKDHQRKIIDIDKDHYLNDKKILKDDFYNEVAFSCEGLNILKNYGANYFVYFYNLDSNSAKKIEFLNQNLEIVGEFKNIEQVDSYGNRFYKVINTGNNFSNQSIVYKISENKICK